MAKTLVLAEKPSVARELARVLGCKQSGEGYLEGEKYIVTWALGHLVELAPPEDYDKAWAKWDMLTLPMLPERMKTVVIPQSGRQFRAVQAQLRRGDVGELVIATDAGREGELVARWILEKAGWKGPARRLWISSQTDKAIREGFTHLRPAAEYDNLFRSARARSEADWLVGLNVTRALTCRHNAQLSAGRVQTPTLALIVEREEAIRRFVPQEFWTVTAKLPGFTATWRDPNGQARLFDRERAEALAARLDRLCRPAMGLNEGEKERYVHDFICRNVRYDKLKKPYSHEILGPLGQGVGVCEGIAKAVKCLCDRLGVWCIVALAENNPDKGVKYRHAWNVVRLGDAYYHLDATFDNSLGSAELVRYDYFNLDDRRLFRDHEALVYPVPACADGGRFYYREAKLSFTRPEEVAGRAAQAVRKGKPLVFHWRGGPLTGEVLGELAALLEEAAARKGRHAAIRLNRAQAVLEVHFQEAPPAEACTAQEANEGEEEG